MPLFVLGSPLGHPTLALAPIKPSLCERQVDPISTEYVHASIAQFLAALDR
jgi:hypothetical protein